MKLIAFVAPKEYGKTTACNILKEYYGSDNVVQINFKDGLIAELKQNFPDLLNEILKTHYTEGGGIVDVCDLFRVKPRLIRTLMQNYGTDVRRKDNDKYWVNEWAGQVYTTIHTEKKNVLTDDCRFLNEARAVKEAGGILIRLNRTDKTNTDTHPSEQEQKDILCDYEVTVGEGELDVLRENMINLAKFI